MCNNEDKFSGSQREQATCSASHQLPGGWQKMNRNHGWLIWVSYSQQHYSAVGSAGISLRLALCPASIQSTGNEHLLPLPKVRLWVFRPGCSVWTFFFLREAQAIIVVAPGSKASCFGSQRQWRAIKLLPPLDWFTGQPINMQTTHHMLRIEPLGLKVYTLEELTPGQNPPTLYQSVPIGCKTCKCFVLYPLWCPALAAVSQLPKVLMRGRTHLLLHPALSQSLLSAKAQYSTLAAPSSLETTCGPSCLAQDAPLQPRVRNYLFRPYSIWCELLKWGINRKNELL